MWRHTKCNNDNNNNNNNKHLIEQHTSSSRRRRFIFVIESTLHLFSINFYNNGCSPPPQVTPCSHPFSHIRLDRQHYSCDAPGKQPQWQRAPQMMRSDFMQQTVLSACTPHGAAGRSPQRALSLSHSNNKGSVFIFVFFIWVSINLYLTRSEHYR